MTQAFKVSPVSKQLPASLVILDVIHVGRTHSHASLCALTAERLSHQLIRPEIISPFRCVVHPTPGLRLLASICRRRFVCRAVRFIGEHEAARVPARPQRFIRHSDRLRQNKKPGPTTTHLCDSHWPWLSKHWPCSKSILNSLLQVRQYAGMFTPEAVLGTRVTLWFIRQYGHSKYPFFTTNSLPCFCDSCNTFHSIS